jgi:2,5-diamino-6-(ribosylamino)-4(3H)-pyrimidinone 5'-phosphate reductase
MRTPAFPAGSEYCIFLNCRAVNLLGECFGIGMLLLERGGNINGAFLQAGLIEEMSLLVVPGIDGRYGISAVFDGASPSMNTAIPLKLKSVEWRQNDGLWIRYEAVRSEQL